MGSATIVLTDALDHNGEATVDVKVEFDPLIDIAAEQATVAQLYALKMLDAVAEPEDLEDAVWSQ